MEAIFARSIELTYVGPGPALNAYAKSQGDDAGFLAFSSWVVTVKSGRPA
jgi:NitT/TauT family transport system substrate-binding protein